MVRHYKKLGIRKEYTKEERARALNLFLFHKSVSKASMLSGVYIRCQLVFVLLISNKIYRMPLNPSLFLNVVVYIIFLCV